MTASPPGDAGIVGSMLAVEPVHPLIVADRAQHVRHRDRLVPSVGELPGEQLALRETHRRLWNDQGSGSGNLDARTRRRLSGRCG
jgi:hypothetical protein